MTNRIKDEFFKSNRIPDILTPLLEGKKNTKSKIVSSNTVRVKGVDNIAMRLSRCCNPLPGDPIVGYITRGKGVSVHRKDCPNFYSHLGFETGRIIEVEWADRQNGTYLVEIEVSAWDRPRLTTDVMTTIADAHVSILSVFSRQTKNNMASINLKLEIKDLQHLQAVMQRVGKIKDVTEVRRVVPGEGGGTESERSRGDGSWQDH